MNRKRRGYNTICITRCFDTHVERLGITRICNDVDLSLLNIYYRGIIKLDVDLITVLIVKLNGRGIFSGQ